MEESTIYTGAERREVSIAILQERIDVLTRAVADIGVKLDKLSNQQIDEIAGCPFQPKRGTNGNTIIARVDSIERENIKNRSYLKGILFGIGILGIFQLGPPGWQILLKLFIS